MIFQSNSAFIVGKNTHTTSGRIFITFISLFAQEKCSVCVHVCVFVRWKGGREGAPVEAKAPRVSLSVRLRGGLRLDLLS